MALGRCQRPNEIHGGLAEGVFTAPVLLDMAHERGVDMPISAAEWKYICKTGGLKG